MEIDKLETLVNQVQEALAMPTFRPEQNDQSSERIRQAVSEQSKSSANSDETAAIQLNDESIPTDSAQHPARQGPLAFLSPPQATGELGRLNGYRVLKLLGEGGMGLVFEAEDVRLKRRVALKVMKPEVAVKEQHRLRFLREAETAAKVEHDHICPIYQVGEENGVPFIAMPFLKGEPLDVRLKRQKPLPIAEAIHIGQEVAEGLAAAHDAGLVHRDIKPGNIWLEKSTRKSAGSTRISGRVKILDFGLARLTVDDIQLTQSGAIMGTPAYMAPEQARGKPVDHRADLFSLGVVLYEMTTGHRPFTGGDTMSILTSLALDEPTAPSLVNFEVSGELSDLIMRLLAKSPEKRPADGREVAEALMAILMRTAQPIVESLAPSSVSRGTRAAPLAEAVDATAVDPWGGLDESESQVEPPKPARHDPKPISRDAQPLRSGARTRFKLAIALAFFFLIGGGFAAYKLFFETKDGTLVVEVDGDADVRFKNGELQIFDADGKLKYTLKPGERSKTMPPGPYKVQVVSADGVKLNTDKFEMSKDSKVTLRVTADVVAVAQKDSGKNDPKQSGSMPAPQTSHRLQLSGNDTVSFATLKYLPLKGELTVEGFVTVRKKHGGGHSQLIGENLHMWLGLTNAVWSSYVFHKIIESGELMVPDRRVHLAIVRSAKQSRFYVNGKLATVHEGSGERALGRHEGEFGLFGAGTLAEIDEVRVSTVARYVDKEFTPTQRFMPDKETLALYHCDEGQGDMLTDSSGNNHHGKIVGAKWVKSDGTIAPAAGDYALSLDGGGINPIPFNLDSSKPFSVEGYLTPNRDRPGNAFGLFPRPWIEHISTYWTLGGISTKIVVLHDKKSAVVGKKTHVAIVSDGKKLRMFVDGVLTASAEIKDNPIALDPKLAFKTYEFGGVLQEVRISTVARYDKDFTPAKRFETDKDTLALYHFDEGSGDVLKDSSGNGHHGKIVGAKWVKADGSAIGTSSVIPPLDPAWLKAVAVMPTAQHIEAVKAELMKRNPGFDGAVMHKVGKDRVVAEFTLSTDKVTDISPVRALTELQTLNCAGAWTKEGSKVPFADLSPLKGMKLTHLTFGRTEASDLSPLKGMKLMYLNCAFTNVSDLSPLKDMELLTLNCTHTRVADLSPLKGMSLTSLICYQSFVADLSPLKGMPLTTLNCEYTRVTDLSPLKGMPLKDIRCDFKAERDVEILRSIKTLETINDKPVTEFWKEVDTQQAAFDAWLKQVAAMKAEQQVEAVKAELMKRNPGFDGMVTPMIDKDGVVTGLTFLTDNVTDISPVRALIGLTTLGCFGTPGNGKLADLSPLKGMKLTSLDCFFTRVVDLSPLSAMSLTHLHCGTTGVADLSPLRNMKLAKLLCNNTQVTDLSPLKGMPLTYLAFEGTPVSDLLPLKGMPLTHLRCESTRVTDLSPLKGMKLTDLNCANTQVVDLAPLNGMPLNYLVFSSTPVADLKALKDMPLTNLHFGATRVADLTPLKGMMLERLRFEATLVSDLSPLKGMPLTWLVCSSTQVSDLSPLKGMPLTWLLCSSTRVSDLSPLKGMKLIHLNCMDTRVTDLSPVEGMPLVIIGCDFRTEHDSKILRPIKTLETINDKPVAEFWKEVEGKKASAFPPFDLAWLKAVAAMPADKQVEAVKAELMKRNPGFDGKMTHKIDAAGVVKELQFLSSNVTDISPVRALSGLAVLSCKGGSERRGELTDLSPLKGMQLTNLDVSATKVSDLASLKDMPLTSLACSYTAVSDLSTLKGMPLTNLSFVGSPVADLTPLKGVKLERLELLATKVSDLLPLRDMKLRHLDIAQTQVSDLSPLKDMPLTYLKCDYKAERDKEILRSIKTLEKINDQPAAEFLK